MEEGEIDPTETAIVVETAVAVETAKTVYEVGSSSENADDLQNEEKIDALNEEIEDSEEEEDIEEEKADETANKGAETVNAQLAKETKENNDLLASLALQQARSLNYMADADQLGANKRNEELLDEPKQSFIGHASNKLNSPERSLQIVHNDLPIQKSTGHSHAVSSKPEDDDFKSFVTSMLLHLKAKIEKNEMEIE